MNKYFLLFVFAFTYIKLCGQSDNIKLSLNDALMISIKQNPLLIESSEQINVAEGRFWSGISLPKPLLDLSLEFIPISKRLSNYSEKTFSILQTFEFPTNYFLKGNKLSNEKVIANYQHIQKERQIIAEVKTAYYNVLTKQELIKYAKENLSISEDFYNKAKIRYNVGEGTNIELLTAKVQLSEANNKLNISENEFRISLTELNFLLGNESTKHNNYILTDTLEFKLFNLNLDDIYSLSSNSNPSIKIAELNIDISSVERTIAWSSLLPNFNLAYFRQDLDGNGGFYGASFGIEIPLWFLFEQRGNIKEANAKHLISDALYIQTKNEISLIAKNAYMFFLAASQQLSTYTNDILPQAEEVYRAGKNSYDVGELTYLEYLQVKQLLNSAKENYIVALFNYNKSIASLEEILGKNINELEN
ncbi:MAG: TolC family protein [Ignavibacteriae bacterium]|nr:TolC family protein [Ignavibacteriota bacterium]